MKGLYVKSRMINIQDLEEGKEEKFRLWAREVWKCALRLDNEQWPSRGGKRREIEPAGRMWVSEEGQNQS